MSKLTTLRGKDPKEVARLLSVVSSSLLPHPGINDVIHQTATDREFVRAVINEIRGHLRIPQGDESVKTYSQIYAFLSEEISKAALADVDISKIRDRLGNKGELHPSQYKVSFMRGAINEEALGDRKSSIIEAINRPDAVADLRAKYMPEGGGQRLTISTKLINTKRAEDRFILFVVSSRFGQTQTVGCAFRVYLSEVDLMDANEPLEVIRAFLNIYGLTFKVGGIVSKFMHNQLVSLNPGDSNAIIEFTYEAFRPLDKPSDHRYWVVAIGGETRFTDSDGRRMAESVLSFVVDISKYVETLRKHHVNLDPNKIMGFPL